MAKMKLMLARIIPTKLLDSTKTEIKALVKSANNEELHDKVVRLMGFVDMFVPLVKEELIARLKKQVKSTGDKSVVTSIGEITLNKRRNTFIDEYSLKKYLKRKRSLGVESCFDTEYELVTQNKKVLTQLEDKGLVVKNMVFNKEKYNKLKKTHPEFEDFEEENPTFYLKGM
jgi:hypothetical protein